METRNSATKKQSLGKLKDRLLWIFFAVLAFALLYPITYSAYSEWMVYKYGKIVSVQIISMPNEHSPTNFMKFDMNGHAYDKRLNKYEFNDFSVGEKIQLKYLKGYENFFVFPNKNPTYSGLGVTLMFLVAGICCLYYGLKKDPVPFRMPFTGKQSSGI